MVPRPLKLPPTGTWTPPLPWEDPLSNLPSDSTSDKHSSLPFKFLIVFFTIFFYRSLWHEILSGHLDPIKTIVLSQIGIQFYQFLMGFLFSHGLYLLAIQGLLKPQSSWCIGALNRHMKFYPLSLICYYAVHKQENKKAHLDTQYTCHSVLTIENNHNKIHSNPFWAIS